MQKITTFLWFDKEAHEAATFYCSVFPDSKILTIARYPEGGPGPAGSVMTVEFQLSGQRFMALNGGPTFKFTENAKTTQLGQGIWWSVFTIAGLVTGIVLYLRGRQEAVRRSEPAPTAAEPSPAPS